jgi:hypothetical protein
MNRLVDRYIDKKNKYTTEVISKRANGVQILFRDGDALWHNMAVSNNEMGE